ncbi:MAG: site-specific DNA-methyltransferase [Nitrospinae bacterium]|nr:site-specific DNA-methyltransferase [Nitrospinota bacterium]
MRSGSVDLIYLDPPFYPNREYCAIYKDETGHSLPAQTEAYCDLWTLGEEREQAIQLLPVFMREAGIDEEFAQFWKSWMNALRNTQPHLLAYLSYLAERLLPMKSILKRTGGIYLHCDPVASHYIKVLMDGIFGHYNFRNEIIWSYKQWPTNRSHFQAMHDVILFYGKGKKNTFNVEYEPVGKNDLKRLIGTTQYLDSEGSAGKIPADEMTKGMPLRDVWDIPVPDGSSKKRPVHEMRKSLALLQRIIKASSNPGDVVLDPFCGCATTMEAAHNLGRRWIGIDISIHAIRRAARMRLENRLGLVAGQDFVISGIPRTIKGAQNLWKRDKFQFQKWAIEEVRGFVTTKRTAEGRIDGRRYFSIPGKRKLQSMAIEVKGGKSLNITDLRALEGVLENDAALMAGLIIMEPLALRSTWQYYHNKFRSDTIVVKEIRYPRVQVLAIEEILKGERFDTPGEW